MKMDWLKILGPELAAKARPETRSKYLKKNFLRQYLIVNFLNQVLSLVRLSGAKSIMDIGCGEGLVDYFLLKALPGLKIVGGDQDEQALAVARVLNPGAQYQEMDGRATGLADASFDLVMANEVLEHLADYPKVIQEAARVSKKYFLVSVPEWPFYQATNFLIGANWRTLGEHPDHVVAFTYSKLRAEVQRSFSGPQIWKRAYPWLIGLAEKS
jgi:SAM-dependent methyltransferase